MIRWLVGAIGFCVVATHALAADPVEIGIGYLGHTGVKSKISLVEQPSDNDGIAGARLAIEDNNTTGKFLNQHFTLEEVRLKEGEDVAKAAVALASSATACAGRASAPHGSHWRGSPLRAAGRRSRRRSAARFRDRAAHRPPSTAHPPEDRQ